MNLDLIAQIGQIIMVILILPTGLWKAWRSIDRRLDESNSRLIRVEAQFFKNGGGSLKDDIIQIKEAQANIKGRLGL